MEYNLQNIFEIISREIDVVYLTDSAEGTYHALKDNSIFRSMFGNSGSYQEMMNLFMENTIDKVVTDGGKYNLFFKTSGGFKGKFTNKSRIRIDDRELIISISNFPLNETKSALLIYEMDEKDYIQDIHKDEKVNIIKSAYLFSMNIDLVADTCANMNMSEVDDNPVNQLNLSYTQWREMISNMFYPEDQEMFRNFSDPDTLRNTLSYHRSKSVDCQMMNLEGKFIWVKLIFNRVDTGDDNDFRMIFMVEDIHDSHIRLMDEMKKYENMAKTDSLTGLCNHGRIESELEEQLIKCRSENNPVSLIMFDIDHFKHVNDTYGHAVGDIVLKTISAAAKKLLKEYGCILGRWGGEEFLGVCPGLSDEKMQEAAEQLRKTVEETEFETAGHITSSFGVIQVNDNETAEEAFKRIDTALYTAKESGRNRVVKG